MRNWIILIMKPSILVGGQAVIEGVMMRVPGAYATAVRDPKGNVHIDRHKFNSVTEYSTFWKKPVFRGMAALFEAMKMGMATLQWSADIAFPDESDQNNNNQFFNYFSNILAIALAVMLFLVLPYWITSELLNLEKNALPFNVVAGTIRILFFVLYILLISLMKDVKRLFSYHGAEHKVVYNFESGRDISISHAQSFPTQHPRCGTSFMFIVLLSAIIVFAIIDTLILSIFETINLPMRLLFHLPLIPLVAGVSYELIKLSVRHGDKAIVRLLQTPGLWLQLITTKQPDDAMVDVAITALESAFGDQLNHLKGKKFIAEAIG